MELLPLGDRILLEKVKRDTTKDTGILIPESVDKKYYEAKVITKGYFGGVTPLVVGDIVLVSKMSGIEVKVDGKDFVIVRHEEILAKMLP
jgi:chaperonin GroES